MSSHTMQVEVAKEIWKIAGKSDKHGNAVMDLLGEDIYLKVMELQKENLLFAAFKD